MSRRLIVSVRAVAKAVQQKIKEKALRDRAAVDAHKGF